MKAHVIRTRRAAALLAGLSACALLAGPLNVRAEVGIAAAVNVDAKGRAPGAAPRVIALGQNVVYNEEITTDTRGLVQILLLDGTTFTVGPNSRLTIDEFVYNPATGEAKVVASVTKGAFRFIGAKTSQTDGGATIKTPVGTIGVRGAMVEGNVGDGGSALFSMVFGKEVNFTGTSGNTERIFKAGYTMVVADASGSNTSVRKRTNDDAMTFQTGLAGDSEQSGSASEQPSDTTVAQSPVAAVNSQQQLPASVAIPAAKPVGWSTLDPDELENDVANVDSVAQNNVNEDIAQQTAEPGPVDPGSGPGPQPEPEPEPEPIPATNSARLYTSPGVYETYFGDFYPDAGGRGLIGSTPESDQTLALARVNGRLQTTDGSLSLPDLTGAQGDTTLTPFDVSGSSPLGPVSGPAYAGRGDFVAYLLGVNGDPTQPFYLIHGTPTDAAALAALDSGNDIRRYTLTRDPIRNSPLPFFAPDLYGETTNFGSTDLYAVEPSNSPSQEIRMFQSFAAIDGEGVNQKSAIGVYAGAIFQGSDDQWQMGGSRRGSFRTNAFAGPTHMRGSTGTIPGATGAHLFGPNAEHFVMGTTLDPADAMSDSAYDGFDPAATGYLQDGNFSTHHVASLVDEGAQGPVDSSSRDVRGFMAGIGQSRGAGTDGTYVLRTVNPNFVLSLSDFQNSTTATATVVDVDGQSDVVGAFFLPFGAYNGTFGNNTFVDDNNFAALHNGNPANTTMITDGGSTVQHQLDVNPGSYLVSGRAAPVAGYEHCTSCDFIDWGWWGTQFRSDSGSAPELTENRRDFVHMGTWVAGDISSTAAVYDPANLPFGGSASYAGTALGSVVRNTPDGVAQYIARGNVAMDYDFSARNGNMTISNFDGMTVAGAVTDTSSATGQATFAGGLSGGPDLAGNVGGAFVNDGPNVAAGVIGDFSFNGTGVNAAGTIAAAATP